MKTKIADIINNAMELSAIERAGLADELISSLDTPDKAIDNIWRNEIDNRLTKYEKGEIKTLSVEEVLAKYKTK